MTQEDASGHQSEGRDHEPDFTFPHHDVVHEDNWEEFRAKGWVAVPEELKGAQAYFGTENVYTGDAYDVDADRPLRHKPGVGVYVTPEGLKHLEQKKQDRGLQSSSGGSSSEESSSEDPSSKS